MPLRNDNASSAASVFATTHWSVVLAAHSSETPAASAAFETIFRSYEKPLRSFILRRGYPGQDVDDLLQSFFHRLLAKDVLRAASRERGRFRTFLLASLHNFLTNHHDHQKALKRGGGQAVMSLDADGASQQSFEPPSSTDPAPEVLFDREWARTIFDHALRRLEREFADDGKQAQFAAVVPFLTQPPAAGDYERVAARIGTRPQLMATVVARLRQRFRDLVRVEIAATVATPAEIDTELRYLVELMTS